MKGLHVRTEGEDTILRDERGPELHIPPEPSDWKASFADWVITQLDISRADYTREHEAVIRAAVECRDGVRSGEVAKPGRRRAANWVPARAQLAGRLSLILQRAAALTRLRGGPGEEKPGGGCGSM
jgi:hypothetical protein